MTTQAKQSGRIELSIKSFHIKQLVSVYKVSRDFHCMSTLGRKKDKVTKILFQDSLRVNKSTSSGPRIVRIRANESPRLQSISAKIESYVIDSKRLYIMSQIRYINGWSQKLLQQMRKIIIHIHCFQLPTVTILKLNITRKKYSIGW